jgi:class 3 adenylate cyclase/tetratricopeptide (TPR) repeat protein
VIDVFLSYTSEDRSIVETIVRALEETGLNVWWDKHIRSGKVYDREIEQAIESASCIVVVWSQRSVESDWVRNEASEGLERDCLVPVRIDETRPPLAFRRVQTIDLKDFAQAGDKKLLVPVIASVRAKLSGEKKPATSKSDGDRREITYVAALVTGIASLGEQMDPEDLEEVREELSSRVSRITALYGGIVNHSTNNQFGVIFGLPSAHEDDPVRAVHFGLALDKELKEIRFSEHQQRMLPQLGAKVGIDSGLVVAKIRDSSAFQVSGNCISAAENLLELAEPDQVLISPTTQASVAPYFSIQTVQQGTIHSNQRECFQVTGPSGVHTRIDAANARGFTPHRGREQELSLLIDAASRAFSGRGRVALLTGDAGVGKSRLGRELLAALADQNFQVLEGTCQSYGTRSPYLPFMEVLETLLDPDTSLRDREEALAIRARELDPALEQMVPLLLHLHSIPPLRYPATQLEGLSLRAALQDAVVATITIAARKTPVLLLLEDWHWADTASDEVLQRVTEIAAGYPLFVLVSARPTLTPKWLSHSNVAHIKLAPLSREDTRAFVCGLWNVESIPAEFVDLMQQTTDGNPFFIEEICRALMDDDQIEVRDGEAVFNAALSQLQLPSSVQSVIRSRLDQLAPQTLEVLNCASVIGREFSRPRLQAIAASTASLTEALNELVEAELIVQTQLLPEPEFEFKHALTQVVVYDSLLRNARRKIHDQVGLAIESATADRPDEEVEMLAYHFARGEEQQRAIEYTLRAGEKAAARSATQEAASHFNRAAELISHADEQRENQRQHLRALVNLGTALMVTKGYGAPEVIDAFSQALDLSKEVAGSREQFSTLWGLWRYYYNEAQLFEARDAADKLLEIAIVTRDEEHDLAAHTALGVVDLISGHFAAAAEHLEKAIHHIGVGDSKWLAAHYGMSPEVMALTFFAMVKASQGYFEEARESVTKACMLANSINHDATLAFAHYYGANVAMLQGDPAAIREHVSELARVAQAARFPHWIALADYQSAMLDAAGGKAAEALPRILDAKDRVANMGVGLLEPSYAVGAVPMNLALNRSEEAAVELADAQLAIERGGLHYFDSSLYRAKGLLAQQHDSNLAAEQFDLASERAAELGQTYFQIRALCDLLKLQRRVGDADRATQKLSRALSKCDEKLLSSPECERAKQLLAGS